MLEIARTGSGTQSKLPNWAEGIRLMSHLCCLPGCALAGTWSHELELQIEPRHANVRQHLVPAPRSS